MQLATGGDMLNFGYWNDSKSSNPTAAQNNLCSLVGEVAELESAKTLIDIGSGLSGPAARWKCIYNSLDISCININFQQLSFASSAYADKASRINATSIALPFSSQSVDRVIALESAQHFRPLEKFIMESKRILQPTGLLIVASPVVTRAHTNPLKILLDLGILSLTWSSERYDLEYVKSIITKNGFGIKDVMRIGHRVYEPLTNYYVLNRNTLRLKILTKYSSFLEYVLYKSLLKMNELSKKGMIDYVIIKAST
jgi:cyclopropane fatty-acyl-phospholipid synthase-like methyltransferase